MAKLLQATLKDKIEKGDSMAFRTVRTRHSEYAANSSPAIKGSPQGEGIAGLVYNGSGRSGLLSAGFDWQDSVRHAIADRRCPNIWGMRRQTNVGQWSSSHCLMATYEHGCTLRLLMYFSRLVDVCQKRRGHFARSRNKSCNKEILVLMPSRTSDTKVPLSFSSSTRTIHIVQIFLYNHKTTVHNVVQNRISITSYEAKQSVTPSALAITEL